MHPRFALPQCEDVLQVAARDEQLARAAAGGHKDFVIVPWAGANQLKF